MSLKIFDRILRLLLGAIVSVVAMRNVEAHCAENPRLRIIVENLQYRSIPDLETLGDDYAAKNKNDSALACYMLIGSKLGTRLAPSDSIVVARAFNHCGHLLMLRKNYTEAYRYFLDAHEMPDSMEKFRAEVYLSVINSYFGNEEESDRYLRSAYRFFLSRRIWSMFFSLHHNLINRAFAGDRLEDVAKDIEHFSEIRHVMPDDTLFRYLDASNSAIRHLIAGDTDSATVDFERAEKIISTVSHRPDLIVCSLENLSKAYYLQKSYRDALSCMKRAVEIADSSGYTEMLVSDYKMMAEYSKALNDTESMLRYRIKSLDLRDSIFSSRDFGLLRDMEAATTIRDTRRLLEIANEQNRFRSRMLVMACVASTVFLILLLIVIATKQKIREAYKALYLKNTELIKKSQIIPSELDDGHLPETQNMMPTTRISDKLRTDIMKAINTVLSDVSYISNPMFSLSDLARLIGYNYKYVSQTINDSTGLNFKTLLNRYRVREACLRLGDVSKCRQFTIESIGREVGFRSRSNFIATFKKEIGLTPKEYQRQACNGKGT